MTTNQSLGATALLLGVFAALAQTPRPAAIGTINVTELAGMVAREQDHVDAIDLARWIKDRKPGLRVIDVRPTAEFDDYHLPTAQNVPLEQLGTAGFTNTDTIVMYSRGGAHAAQAWVMLRALGLRQVYFLSGGLDEWIDDVLNPTLPEDATAEEKAAFAITAEIGQYFGGIARVAPRDSIGKTAKTSDAVTQLKRRGC